MPDVIVQLVLSAVGGSIGAIVGYWFWVRQQLQEIRAEYDRELRTARMTAYRSLWRGFAPLAVYSPSEDISYERITKLGVELRKWYFDEGGLFFTDRARNVYFLVQDAIDRLAQVSRGRKLLRGVDKHWTRTELDSRRDDLKLSPLTPSSASTEAHVAWENATSEWIEQWSFGSRPDDDFVILQFLASSLRTVLARDLHARNPSILS
jgi:hypothetical protein